MALKELLDFMNLDLLRLIGTEAGVENATNMKRMALTEALAEQELDVTLNALIECAALDTLVQLATKVGIRAASVMNRELLGKMLADQMKERCDISSPQKKRLADTVSLQAGSSECVLRPTGAGRHEKIIYNQLSQGESHKTVPFACGSSGEERLSSLSLLSRKHSDIYSRQTNITAHQVNITEMHNYGYQEEDSLQCTTDDAKGMIIQRVIEYLKKRYIGTMNLLQKAIVKVHLKDIHGKEVLLEDLVPTQPRGLQTLIQGQTGTGLTTICVNLVRDWIERKPYMLKISLLIYFNLEELAPGEDLELVLLDSLVQRTFRCSVNSSEARSLITQYIAQHGDKVMLLLDGFDKLSLQDRHSLHTFFNYKHGARLTCFLQSSKILTGRDTAFLGYSFDLADCLLKTNLLNLKQQEIFVKGLLQDQSSLFLNILEDLQISDKIRLNPKFLTWMCSEFKRNFCKSFTKTDVYALLTKELSGEYLSRFRQTKAQDIPSFSHQAIPKQVLSCAEHCYVLCTKHFFRKKKKEEGSELDYRAIAEDEINMYLSWLVDQNFQDFGWFEKEMDFERHRIIFFDRCLLEFLAAFYLFVQSKFDYLTKIHDMFFAKVHLFLSGLMKTKAHSIFDILRKKNIPGSVECLYETGEIGDSNENKISFSRYKDYIGVWNPLHKSIYDELLRKFFEKQILSVWEIKLFEEEHNLEIFPAFAFKNEKNCVQIRWSSVRINVPKDQELSFLQHPIFERIVKSDYTRLLFICNVPHVLSHFTRITESNITTHDVHLPLRALVLFDVQLTPEFFDLLTDVLCRITCKSCGLSLFECRFSPERSLLYVLDIILHLLQFLKKRTIDSITVFTRSGTLKIKITNEHNGSGLLVEQSGKPHYFKTQVVQEDDFINVESLDDIRNALYNDCSLTVRKVKMKNINVTLFTYPAGFVQDMLSHFRS